MKFTKEQITVMKWFARISALIILLIGLPFYFGYGNPLPFINLDYTLVENTGLTAVPIIIIGLALGWKYEKIGGYMVTLPLILCFTMQLSFPINMLIALIPGLLYLIVGYNKKYD